MAGRRNARIGAGIGILVLGLIATLAAVQRFAPATPTEALPAPRFLEEAAAAGVDHRYDGEFTYFVGGGVAVFDCDGDGRQDLYLAGGELPAALYRNRSPVGGALSFEEVHDGATDLTEVTGAYPLDIDGDAKVDLAVLRVGENVLLRGLGDCAFERANQAWGYDGGAAWTAAFSATWEAGNSLPTLAFGNYLVPDSVTERSYVCDEGELVRPDATGRAYAPGEALAPGRCALSALFSDWDRSGRRDLRISNDRHYYGLDGEEQLWRIAPGELPRLYSHDEGWQTVKIWGMGIASHDLTGDGYPEVYLTSQGDNKLQTLTDGPAQPHYEDIALRSGATAHRPYAGDVTQRSTAWHAEFADVNNDGFVDLFVAKGNVEAMTDFAARDPSNLLIGQPDGTFVEGAMDAGIVSFARARGAALADLNLDGLLDLVVVNRRENVSLWRNIGADAADEPEQMGNWIALRLIRDGANRDAIGAWVEVRVGELTIRHEVTVGGGHAGGQLGWIHIGLGGASRATVQVRWPDGEVGPELEIEANRFAVIERGATEAQPWVPPEETDQ
ncbi:MAG: CRTAC1 family protein [Candidatus Limnocylindria bacterium]